MELTIWRLFASAETDLVLLGVFDREPTMDDVNTSDYRGYTIVVQEVQGEVPLSEALEIRGYTLPVIDGDESEQDVWEELTLEDKAQLLEDADYSDYQLGVIPKVNEESDNLLDRVQRDLATALSLNYFAKYQTVWIDNEGNMYGRYAEGSVLKQIRIADHTHNPANGRSDLTVVIAEKNATAGRFQGARTNLIYDEDADPEQIVSDIINYFKS